MIKQETFLHTHTVAQEEDYASDDRDDDEVYEEMEEICINELKTRVANFCLEQNIDPSAISYSYQEMDWDKNDPHYHFIYEFNCPENTKELLIKRLMSTK